jgi:hypothetical protein
MCGSQKCEYFGGEKKNSKDRCFREKKEKTGLLRATVCRVFGEVVLLLRQGEYKTSHYH